MMRRRFLLDNNRSRLAAEEFERRTRAAVIYYELLAAIYDQADQSIKELSFFIHRHDSTMSKQVGHLVRDDLVTKHLDENDSRTHRVRITPKGVIRLTHMDTIADDIYEQLHKTSEATP